MSIEVQAADRVYAHDVLSRNHSLRVGRTGELLEPLDHPALMAVRDGTPIALATYIVHGESCEILTLHADVESSGAGTALLDAVASEAKRAGCTRLWLITTNDNTHAIRFYQRRGFTISGINVGGVDEVRRTVKPDISERGNDGIPIRDEIVFEILL